VSLQEIVGNIFRWRSLVWVLAKRDFRRRYAGSVLGAAWAIIEPGVQFGLYFLVFSVFLGMRIEGNPGGGSYAMYLLSGLIPFLLFQESLMRSAGLAHEQAGLARHVRVPLEVLLAGTLVSVFLRHMFGLAILVAIAVAFGHVVLSQLPWLGIGVMLLAAGSFGVALALVPAGAFLPDLNQLVGMGGMVLFFLTPIVYTPTVLPAKAAPLLLYNPLVGLLETFRVGIMGGNLRPSHVLVTTGAVVVSLWFGQAVFRRRAHQVPDLV
jgi:ABC-type polysaccharide/polyol phosphate export permease